MADNYTSNPGAGGLDFSSDEISSVHHPRVKVEWGADGSAIDCSDSAPMPVMLVASARADTGNKFSRLIDIDETPDQVDTASAAKQLLGFIITNESTAKRYVHFYNAATTGAVTVGTTTPDMTIPLEGSVTIAMNFPYGLRFSSGLVVAATTTLTGSTGPGANEVIGNFFTETL